jgi:hypothetical protein
MIDKCRRKFGIVAETVGLLVQPLIKYRRRAGVLIRQVWEMRRDTILKRFHSVELYYEEKLVIT